MSKRFRKMLSFLCCLVMLTSLTPVSFAAVTDNSKNVKANDTPTAMFGTPELGSNDPLWALTTEHLINKSTVPGDPRPHATGTAKILWDNDYVYARVAVKDRNLYRGPGADHTYDSIELYVGPGSNGSNQWRVSSTGILSGQSHTDRAAWTEITNTGYIVEMRIPKGNLTLAPGKLTFEVYINNSTANGGDRYEVVSAFGTPDTGYGGHAAFADSLELIEADAADTRFSITTQVDTGGQLTPTAPGNVLRVDSGEDLTFTVTPDYGKIVDAVTVDGKAVTIADDDTFALTNISADHKIHVTFIDDPAADQFPFIVWNDNFASGEYTTAVIIDLGEGRKALASELHPDLFTVSARNTTLFGNSIVYEGTRKISRVYATNEPKVRGYLGEVSHSPDYQDGLASGRYIVVEFEFYTEAGGSTTLDGSSNSTRQNYNIIQNGDIVLTEGAPLSYAVFKQNNVVNPILDKFTSHTSDSVNYALYLHKDAEGDALHGMPLYVYIHGMGRGGTMPQFDQKASMKSANGSVALMKKMEVDPNKYASHILNISYIGLSTPLEEDVKKVIDDLVANGFVDSNRIYVAGFSWGAAYTNTLINAYPGFFAAGAPMAPVFGSPEASDNEAHRDLAYWMLINAHNVVESYQPNLDSFITTNMPVMTNARASNFESNEALTWPYNQYDQASRRPNPDDTPVLQDYIAHEVEAAVLYNEITMKNPFTEETWSIAPIAQSPNLPAWDNDYTDVFDWMFAQSKGSSKPTYTVTTPQGKPAVTDTNGNTTLPGGGMITTKVGTKLEVPEGTTISSKDKVTIPVDKSAEVTLPGDKGISFNIRERTELAINDNTPLGFIVISGNPFNDVNKDDWFNIYVRSVYTFGLFNGTTSTTFSPGTSMTRAMVVQVLANLENVDLTDYTNSRFSDVADGQWYTAAIEWAAEAGIVNGTSADLFDPVASITREQMLVILFNYMNYKGYKIPPSQAQSFADASEISSWAVKAIQALQGIGVVTGKGNNSFDPQGTATRAEAATIFVRVVENLTK